MPSRTSHLLVVASALLPAFACSSFDADPIIPPNGGGVTSYSDALTASLGSVGCVRHEGRIVRGVIGLPGPNGRELFRCEGVPGDQIKAMVAQAREAVSVVPGLASGTAGYTIRHFVSNEYCMQYVTSLYYGDELVGQQIYIDEGSCFWVTYFWDEWEPGSNNDPIPEPYGEGGGPYYSPTDPQSRTPTIDTMPNRDHTCDGTLDNIRPNFQCLKDLSTADSARIYDSIDIFLRPLAQIVDSVQRLECDSLFRWMDTLRVHSRTNGALPYIYAGRTDSVSAGKSQHDAQSNGLGNGTVDSVQLVHVDPKVLGGANTSIGKKRLLRSLMHEAAHAWRGMDHSDSAWANNYADFPFFRTLHAADACIIP